MNYLKIFFETRVEMSRHISNEEKNAVVEEIKKAISSYRARILPKPKNEQFMRFTHLSENDILSIIQEHLKPQCIVGVIPNRNYPEKGSPELYLMKMWIKKYSTYVKVDLRKGKVEFWSIHSLTSSLDRDFQYASDYKEDNLPKTFAWEWMQAYNDKCKQGFKIINRFVKGKTLHFDFECGDVDYDNGRDIVPILLETKPKRLYDIYYIGKSMQLDIVAGGIEIELVEKE